jgi:hypothetical protein
MKRVLAAGLLVACLVPFGAHAEERAGDAALGAISGAVVFGPVGAVAGALVGYTAGPNIARSWRLRSPDRRPKAQAVNRSRPSAAKSAPTTVSHSAGATRPPSTAASAQPAAKAAGSTSSASGMPPVQSLE